MSFEGSEFFFPKGSTELWVPEEFSSRYAGCRDVSVLPYKVLISSATLPKPREKALTRDRNAFRSGQFKRRKRTWNVSVIHTRVVREVWRCFFLKVEIYVNM